MFWGKITKSEVASNVKLSLRSADLLRNLKNVFCGAGPLGECGVG
jgi:hypothetical protein